MCLTCINEDEAVEEIPERIINGSLAGALLSLKAKTKNSKWLRGAQKAVFSSSKSDLMVSISQIEFSKDGSFTAPVEVYRSLRVPSFLKTKEG